MESNIIKITKAQSRKWFYSKVNNNIGYYSLVLRFYRIELSRFKDAVKRFIGGQPSLQSRFIEHNNKIRALIETDTIEFLIHEYSSDNDTKTKISSFLNKRFGLNELHYAIAIFKHSDSSFSFGIRLHPIITDKISFNKIITLIEQYYVDDSLESGPQHAQLVNYKQQEEQYLSSKQYQLGIDYWLNTVGNKHFELPYISKVELNETGSEESSTSIKLSNTLLKQNHLDDYRLFVMLVLFVLFKKYTSKRDIIINYKTQCSYNTNISKLIGCFDNKLPFILQVDDHDSLLTLVDKLSRQNERNDYFADCPNIGIINEIRQKIDHDYDGVFSNILFDFDDNGADELEFANGKAHKVKIHLDKVGPEDFCFCVTHSNGDKYLTLNYDSKVPNIFARNLLESFTELTENLLANPTAPIEKLQFINKTSQHMLLNVFNENKQAEQAEQDNIYSAYLANCDNKQDKIAIIDKDQSYCYHQLNSACDAFINEFSHILSTTKIAVIILDKSIEFVIAILSCIRLGITYIPFDKSYPADRLKTIIDDSKANLIITDSNHFNENNVDKIDISIDQLLSVKPKSPTINTIPDKNDIAYCIYTSGSTGAPKGVMISHQALLNHVKSMTPYLDKSHIMGATAGVAFDATVFEIWTSLLLGKTCVIIPKAIAIDSNKLANIIQRHTIDSIFLTPALFNLSYTKNPNAYLAIKSIFLGGEAPNEHLVKNAAVYLSNTSIYNCYGPTEATVMASIFQVNKNTIGNYYVTPIGKPLDNYAVYILDEKLNLLPPGVVGEIYISGISLSNGYLNLPEKTQHSFINNPFYKNQSKQFTKLMYKTGDIGFWLADGNIRCIGRRDNQVKIRGFRIELDEVNIVLSKISGIKKSIVIIREKNNIKHLIAYVESRLSENEIRDELDKILPNYMIPNEINILDELPLTANGKIDKTALSQWGSSKNLAENHDEPLVRTMISAFSQVLQIDKKQVSVNDDFFTLGGHSLLVVQCIAIIQRTINYTLSVKLFFSLRTPAALAKHIKSEKKVTEDNILNLIQAPANFREISRAQGRMWYLHQFENHTSYNIPGYIKFNYRLNHNVLEKSINQIASRQTILNTQFSFEQGHFSQEIIADHQHYVSVKDLSNCDFMLKNKLLFDEMKALEQCEFSLNSLPLAKFVLIQYSSEESYLLFNMHHAIFDGFSVNILLSELGKFYSSIINQEECQLPHLEYSYLDFTFSQKQWLDSKKSDSQKEFWKKQYDKTNFLALPTDYFRNEHEHGSAEQLSLTIDGELFESIESLLHQQQVSLFSYLISIYSLLLYKYTSQSDITIGSLMANRQNAHSSRLIGCFVNTVFVNATVNGNNPFEVFLKNTHKHILEVNDNQDLPFDYVMSELHQSSKSLFQTMLILQLGVEQEGTWGDDIAWEMTLTQNKTAKFDLLIAAYKRSQHYHIVFEYDTSVFKESRIKSMSQHFHYLMKQSVNYTHNLIRDYDLLSQQHRLALINQLPEINSIPSSINSNLKTKFHDVVKRFPQREALQHGDNTLSYQALLQKVEQLSHHLLNELSAINLENTAGIKIAIYLPKSFHYITAILAIVNIGAVYVPLDIKHPVERTNFILNDCEAKILITELTLSSSMASSPRKVLIDQCLTKSALLPNTHSMPNITILPYHYAYIIYTSGTTGKPKGVQITHYNLLRLFETVQQQFHFNQHDVWSGFHSFAFDFSVWEIWGALLFGGKLVIIDDETAKNIDKFYHEVSQRKVTILNQTPSAFAVFNHADATFNSPLSLRTVIFGGENLQMQNLKSWFNRHGDTKPKLINMYGITEITVHGTYYEITQSDTELKNYSIIGKPLNDLQIHIVDEDLKLSPNNVIGEIVVSGPGVSSGYLSREQLTREKFIANPFSSDPLSLLYKSGDLAMRSDEGNLLYVGRKDSQVKLRGYRIELGEIEVNLAKHDEIKQAFVRLLSTTDSDSAKLTAYYTTVNGVNLAVDTLKRHLAEVLPQYMLPDDFIFMTSLPLTANGKVDVKQLPLPKNNSDKQSLIQPQTIVQQKLVSLWASLLNLKDNQVGINSNFFELGGHSLLAANMLLEATKILNDKPDFIKFSESPTILTLSNDGQYHDDESLLTMLNNDIELSPAIIPLDNQTWASSPSNILLTGVTGFLGIFLLRSLLQQTNATIVCLVRADTVADALMRVKRIAVKFSLSNSIQWDRVEVIVGDLSLERLGLNHKEWQRCAHKIDAIYHVGAWVHHVYDYRKLRAANVNSTIECLKLASLGRNKYFYYISTLSSASITNDEQRFPEQLPSLTIEDFGSRNGYVLSKYIAECITSKASQRGFRTKIYRPGNIANDTINGATIPDNNHLLLLVRSCIQLQCAPDWEFIYDIFPVDKMADFIAQSSLAEHESDVFHLNNPTSPSWLTLIQALNEFGYRIAIVDKNQWYEKLNTVDESNALYPLVGYYLNPNHEMRGSEAYLTNHTQQVLTQLGDSFPNIDTQRLMLFFSYLVKIGFFPQP